MKMFKRVFKTVCLLMALAMMFTACGSANSAPTAENKNTSSAQASTVSSAPAKTEKIVFATIGWGEKSKDFDEVVSQLNEMTKEKINVEAAITVINSSTYPQQLNVMMAGGEDLDLLFIPFVNGKVNLISQNQLMPLDDLLAKYGQDITSSLGKIIDYGKANGKTYVIPFNGSKLYPNTIAMREDILKKYNLNLDSVKSYKDLAKIYEVIKKNEPQMVCLAPNNGYLLQGLALGDKIGKIDTLGDNIGVLLGNDNYNLVNIFETPEYKDVLETMRDWYQKGYILKDAATTSEVGSVMYNQGKVFSYFYVDVLDDLNKAYHHPGITRQGHDTIVKALNNPIVSGSSGMYSCGISSQSKHSEAAMKWWDLMYKDVDAVNTLYWGTEGKHYVKNEDGTISYAPGQETNKGYDTPFNWMFGNTALQYTFKSAGYSADYMAQRVKQNDNAEFSNAFGFTFDPTPVQSQYTAVTGVITQYRKALESGSVDPNVELPKFTKKLKEAGIDQVIAEKQKQLNDWVAQNKK